MCGELEEHIFREVITAVEDLISRINQKETIQHMYDYLRKYFGYSVGLI